MKASTLALSVDSKEVCRYHKRRSADLCVEIGHEKLYICIDCRWRTDRIVRMLTEWEEA